MSFNPRFVILFDYIGILTSLAYLGFCKWVHGTNGPMVKR